LYTTNNYRWNKMKGLCRRPATNIVQVDGTIPKPISNMGKTPRQYA